MKSEQDEVLELVGLGLPIAEIANTLTCSTQYARSQLQLALKGVGLTRMEVMLQFIAAHFPGDDMLPPEDFVRAAKLVRQLTRLQFDRLHEWLKLWLTYMTSKQANPRLEPPTNEAVAELLQVDWNGLQLQLKRPLHQRWRIPQTRQYDERQYIVLRILYMGLLYIDAYNQQHAKLWTTSKYATLTPQEQEACALICQGFSRASASSSLGIARSALHERLAQVYCSLGICDEELVLDFVDAQQGQFARKILIQAHRIVTSMLPQQRRLAAAYVSAWREYLGNKDELVPPEKDDILKRLSLTQDEYRRLVHNILPNQKWTIPQLLFWYSVGTSSQSDVVY